MGVCVCGGWGVISTVRNIGASLSLSTYYGSDAWVPPTTPCPLFSAHDCHSPLCPSSEYQHPAFSDAKDDARDNYYLQ